MLLKKDAGARGDKMRNIFKSDAFKSGLNATILTLAVVGIVILLNIILYKHSFKFDVTENKTFELSQQTIDVLNRLDSSNSPIEATLFTSQNYAEILDYKQKDSIDRLIKQYDKLSKNLNLKVIDMDKNPTLARKYAIEFPYEVAFVKGDRIKVAGLRDIFETGEFAGEKVFTSAIMSITNENPIVAYVIQGHKELDLSKTVSYLKAYMGREGYVIDTINIGAEGRVPDDADLLVDIGASTEFSPKEADIIRAYLNNGGKALFLVSSYALEPQIANLNNMFKYFGIAVNNDIAIDPAKNKNLGVQDMIIPSYGADSIVEKLKEQKDYYMAIPGGRSISIQKDVKNIKIEPILISSTESWGETNLGQYKNNIFKKEVNDNPGPLNLAILATKTTADNKEMKLVVVGNDIFISDKVLNDTQAAANIDFVLNSMAVISNNNQLTTIRPKQLSEKTLKLPTNKQNVLLLILIIIIPLIVFIVGIVLWLKRRHL